MLSKRNDRFINASCLQSLLGYSRRGIHTHPLPPSLPPALHRLPDHTANLSQQDMPAFIRPPLADANSDPRDASVWRTRLSSSVFRITQLAVTSHICTHTLKNDTQTTHCVSWLTGNTDVDFTDSISNLQQVTDSPLRAVCWQGAHSLFTNQQGFSRHIMGVIWTTLTFIWMD